MKFKRNGQMLFWSVGGIGGSVYMTKRAQWAVQSILAYAAYIVLVVSVGVLYAP